MNKQLINFQLIIFTLLLVFSGTFVIGQTQIEPIISSHNMDDCGADAMHKKMLQSNPAYGQQMQDFRSHVQAQSNSITPKSAAIYQIPIVVHVIHKGETVGVGSNVSDENIYKTIREMNERYRKTLPGLGGVDMEIEFVLAVRSPTGQCTKGITRVDMTAYPNTTIRNSYLSSGVQFYTSDGITDDDLKAITFWDQTKYYNIYLVSEFDGYNGGTGIHGYAYMAAAHGYEFDGSVIFYKAFTDEFSKTTSHELGHALNLFHTFEDDDYGTTCPPSDPTLGDECADTPPHIRSQSHCDLIGTNACDGNSSNSLFSQNYMDYATSDCTNQFTLDQKNRALAACSYFRSSFFAPTNLALVPVGSPVADFSTLGSVFCAGQAVKFFNESTCVPNTFLEETTFPNNTFAWTFTNGTVTLTSTEQNPIMNFSVSGSYDVTLTVTTLAGTSTVTKNFMVSSAGSMMNACVPTSSNSGYFAYTVSKFQFNSITSFTSYLVNGYQDLTCSKNTVVDAGFTYPLSITTSNAGQYDQNFEVYIDYNNDGQFSSSELVYSNTVPMGATPGYISSTDFVTSITIPATVVTNTMLRMRVLIDAALITPGKRNCTSPYFVGDIQDYGVMIVSACTVAPTISTQPIAALVCSGKNTSFSVNTSPGSIYNWQVSDDGGLVWTDIINGGLYSNANTQTLNITNSTPGINSYKYRCVLTNSCGSSTSNGETLTVQISPTITSTMPANRCGAGSLVLEAVGSAGLLSWYAAATGGAAIGTGNTFTTPVLSATKTYYVSATNAGCESGRIAVVAKINQDVSIVSNPVNTTICEGQSITLTAANGSSYSWSSGQSGNSVTVSPTQTTTYTVTATSTCVNTASITVIVDACLGVNENDQDDLMVLYPNPTNLSMTIEGENLINYQHVELRDVAGRLILVKKVSGSKMNIDLSHVTNGNYIIHILGTEKTITRKIQVVR